MSPAKLLDPSAFDVYAGWDIPEDPTLTAERLQRRAREVEAVHATDKEQGRLVTRAMLELDRQYKASGIGQHDRYLRIRDLLSKAPLPTHTRSPISEVERDRRVKATVAATANVALSGFAMDDETIAQDIRFIVDDITIEEDIAEARARFNR